MSAIFAAGPHREAGPVTSAAFWPAVGDTPLAIVIDPKQVRDRETLVQLLDELEQTITTDRIALHSLPEKD
jgi:hypothetical protein